MSLYLDRFWRRSLFCCKNLFGARCPGAFAEDFFNIFREDNLAGDEGLCQLGVTFGMLTEDLLSAFVLLIDDARHFFVDESGTLVAIWF